MPATQDPAGQYSSEVLERAAAYPVMVHAEIEAYFEDVVSEVASAALDAWVKRGRASRPLLAMVAHRDGDPIGFPQDIFTMSAQKKLETVVQLAASHWRMRVGNNHGIRGHNLAILFLNIGFVPAPSDQTVINSLDGFGAKRGTLAHTSPVSKPRAVVDPVTEANDIDALLMGLEALDESLTAFRKRHRL